jgi:O-antigen/teichoic acid export membrane protein
MSRTRSAFFGTVSSQLYTIILVGISLFSVPIIISHLNSEIYGLSIIIFQITAYLGLFDFGLAGGVERYLAGTRNDNCENKETLKRIISTSLIVYTLLAFFMIISGNIFAPFAAKIFSAPIKYAQSVRYIVSIISVLLGLQLILRAIGGIFFAHQRQFLSNTLSFVLSLSNMLLTIVFVCLGYGLWSFAYSQIITFVFNAILNIYFFKKYYPYIEFKLKYYDHMLLKEMLSYGFSLFIITISVQVIFQTDRILVGSFISLTAVTIYSICTKVPELVTQFLWKITDNSFPGIVEVSAKDDESFVKIHDKLMKITISLSTITFWYLLIASYPFISLWVGAKYYAGNFFILTVAYLYLIQHTFIHVTAMCLNAAGIAKRIAFMYFLEAVLNIIFSVILIKRFQIQGVILGTLISGLITSVWFIPYLAIKYMKSNFIKYVSSILKPLLISSVSGFVLYEIFGNLFLNIHSWLMLIVYSFVFMIASLFPILYVNKDFFRSLKLKLTQKNADV